MPGTDPVAARYLGAAYLQSNPSWDSEDSPWKAGKVCEILAANKVRPGSIVDVGCGAGIVLAELQRAYPEARLAGFDIAPDAERFWAQPRASGIELTVGDFTATTTGAFDVLLALDVLEHLQDPFAFLSRIRGRAKHYVFHFPLDLSAASVLRETPLLHVRRKVGHVHYFTRNLALALLDDCGYRIVDARYTGAAFTAPQRSLKTWLACLPRRMARMANLDWGIRLFGGETLMVLATGKEPA
jgi:SAM-dependent methyltransferase